MSRVACFLLEDAGVSDRFLRRHAVGPCPAMPGEFGYHNATVFIDHAPTPRTADGYIDGAVQWPRDDPRWPTHCACGYAFGSGDSWQLFLHDLWKRVDGQPGEFSLHNNPAPPTVRAPAGAMWFAWWMSDTWHGADGKALAVMLPDGFEWLIDGPSANNGPGWTRDGTPPLVTARPSILTPGYHGFLTNGILESCS